MKKITALLLFFAIFSQAQVHRFVYEYKFNPDVNKKDSIVTELMALDINGGFSDYQSLAKIKRDSMIKSSMKNMASGMPLNFSNIPHTAIKYEVIKENNGEKVYLIEQIAKDTYKVLENEKIQWKILPEKQKFGSYNGQKATTNWGGRNWVAWFSTDIPFQDGPYKFFGLPGLIIKIEDEAKMHNITLVGNQNIPIKNEESIGSIIGRKPIIVTEEQYRKVWKDFMQNPAQSINGSSGSIMSVNSQNGSNKAVSVSEMGKIMKQNTEKELKNNNNRIEPTLYK